MLDLIQTILLAILLERSILLRPRCKFMITKSIPVHDYESGWICLSLAVKQLNQEHYIPYKYIFTYRIKAKKDA